MIANRFIKHIIILHEILHSIILDWDKIFTSQLWFEFFKLLDTKLKYNVGFYLQIDCQTKVVHRCLKTYLCFFYFYKSYWATRYCGQNNSIILPFTQPPKLPHLGVMYGRDHLPLIRFNLPPTCGLNRDVMPKGHHLIGA